MNFSLTRIVLLIIIIIISVTIGNISTLIKVHLGSSKPQGNLRDSNQYKTSTTNVTEMKISNSFNDLLWFLQISDIHISIFRNLDRLTDLEEFVKVTVDVIRPTVVLASGDLTDAKNEDTFGSRQYEEEWKLYGDVLHKFGVFKKTEWLDVRGNHDNFNVVGPASKENYYRNYSIQGGRHPRSYLHTVRNPSGKVISFIALDACLNPGPKRPFNFFGLINREETTQLHKLVGRAQEMGSSHSVWFGHYPTSCILSSGEGVRSVIASDPGAQAYLCGHLHTMAGVVPHMYTLQQRGFLELELADWKDNRIYRLGAIDHGLFSFVDVPHKEWPVVLVTNPKHALFHIPGREPLQAMATSSYIRLLAFSSVDITSVKVKINNEDWHFCTHVKGPLYVKQWTPDLYSQGIHYMQVEVTDKAGRLKTYDHKFSLDGSSLDYWITPRILLMTNLAAVFQVLFGLSIVGCVIPLALMRLLLSRLRVGQKYVPTSSIPVIRNWYRRFWILANIDKFYYPLIIYPLYVTIGPWTVGEIIEGHIGIIFAWGTFINGAYLPGSFTYGYGFFQMCTYQFPLTLVLGYKLDKRLQVLPHSPRRKIVSTLCYLWDNLVVSMVFIFQLIFLYSFWLSYGSLALVLGPFRTWPLFCTLYLWRLVHQTPLHSIQELADIFQEANFDSPRLKSSHSI